MCRWSSAGTRGLGSQLLWPLPPLSLLLLLPPLRLRWLVLVLMTIAGTMVTTATIINAAAVIKSAPRIDNRPHERLQQTPVHGQNVTCVTHVHALSSAAGKSVSWNFERRLCLCIQTCSGHLLMLHCRFPRCFGWGLPDPPCPQPLAFEDLCPFRRYPAWFLVVKRARKAGSNAP
jgi:hypothetical protein